MWMYRTKSYWIILDSAYNILHTWHVSKNVGRTLEPIETHFKNRKTKQQNRKHQKNTMFFWHTLYSITMLQPLSSFTIELQCSKLGSTPGISSTWKDAVLGMCVRNLVIDFVKWIPSNKLTLLAAKTPIFTHGPPFHPSMLVHWS